MPKTTRAKFLLTAHKNDDGSMNVSGHAVCSDDPNHENKAFNDATPGGNIHLHIAKDKPAQESFEVGKSKEYYIDLIECE